MLYMGGAKLSFRRHARRRVGGSQKGRDETAPDHTKTSKIRAGLTLDLIIAGEAGLPGSENALLTQLILKYFFKAATF
jgi:hypothetical protein